MHIIDIKDLQCAIRVAGPFHHGQHQRHGFWLESSPLHHLGGSNVTPFLLNHGVAGRVIKLPPEGNMRKLMGDDARKRINAHAFLEHLGC